MRVLFLDIDGVILSGNELYRTRNNRWLPPAQIALLNDVCERTGALVIVSSTWRMDERCRDLLTAAGFTGGFHEDWRTKRWHQVGSLYAADRRGGEIADWLDRHQEVERYAIVDDDSDMRSDQLPWFVQTPFLDGMQREHADRLIELLAGAAP